MHLSNAYAVDKPTDDDAVPPYSADLVRSTGHARDIAASDLDAMRALSPYPGVLDFVVGRSRQQIGFFPAHNPRALEYPWVFVNLPESLAGRSILDVGAGVNVLPFLLAERGAQMVTIDSHSETREPHRRDHWNEWGFLDYAQLDPRIISVREPYEAYSPVRAFDGIYSVSVIEHLPCVVMSRWIERFSAQLVSGGWLALTVDLVPNTNALWNYSEGCQVEDADTHGTFDTLVSALRGAHFCVESTNVVRHIPHSRVDVGFVKAVRA